MMCPVLGLMSGTSSTKFARILIDTRNYYIFYKKKKVEKVRRDDATDEETRMEILD